MARPTKTGAEKRDQMVKMRLTIDEKNRLEELAANAGFTVSDFLRVRTLGGAPVQTVLTPEREILLRFHAELGKQGSNLNQITRVINRKDNGDGLGVPPGVVTRAAEEIKALAQLIRTQIYGH